MTLTAGTRLGPYEILSAIGAGGMGEVYRANDPRLGREVAIKIVSERRFDDSRALERLQREARTVASLSHPNIVALYDIGTDQGLAFVVMELLDGEPLDRCIGQTPTWRKALEIGAAVADALAAAHEKGVIHRDLKPANIFVTRDGRVKVLDFGLAKQDPLRSDPHTIGTGLDVTEPGVVLGTVGYMSPEQVKGEPADARSDIFALGCVLYEMVSGRRAFPGATAAEVLAAILRDHPAPLSEGDSRVPATVSAIVQRCLEKQPERRFQSVRDLAFSLRHILNGPETVISERASQFPPQRVTERRRLLVALAGISVAIATGALWRGWRQAPPPLTEAPRPILRPEIDAYQRGRYALDKRSEADLREAARLFRDSIDADPTYAPAWAGLADAYNQLGYGSYDSPEDSFPRAQKAAREALKLDASLPEAYAALGYVSMYYDWDFARSEREFTRAIELKADYALAHQWYAYLLTALQRPLSEPEQQIALAEKADPLSVPIRTDHAYILHYYRQNDRALRAVQLAFDMNPKFPLGYFWLGRIYTSDRRYADAESAFKQIGPLHDWTPAMAAVGYLYARNGRPDDARAVLAKFDALSRAGRYASSYAIAVIHAGLGDRERALSALEAAYGERSHWLVWLNRDPRLDEIREEPRFRDLVRHVGLPLPSQPTSQRHWGKTARRAEPVK